ncbi:hypothetical protein NC653_039358 [Populus alba x Populus x berolinensis]|uniref:Retrovirus-related Pol polyprotein from transposon TNT 1-94 n=1 Tax=Populus alba x Populus x berolinensis TaxID=444605 RepID=A0AAD6PQG8_9ROSI|nr:hypothetical protein NC653_039358 [Populus alba x Populus x berolinensis]
MKEKGEGFVGAVRHGEGVIRKQPENMNNIDRLELEARVAIIIRLYQDDDVMYHVMDEESASTIWIKLESQCMSRSLSNKLYLK